jgi:gliding motility-associated-like protein
MFRHHIILAIRTALSLVAMVFMTEVVAQVRANFSGSPRTGCSPLVVNFSDSSTGNPTSWRWDLGNGTFSQLQNPSATYINPGTYNVKLIVSNGSSTDSIIKSQYITVYANPTVSFTGSPLGGCYPLRVQFTHNSTAGSGNIETFEWDFGDGFTSSDPNPVHVYTSSGFFNVSLRIRNNFGCTKSLTKPAYVQILTGVRAGFTQSSPNSCSVPVTVSFQNTSTGTGTLSYQWNFGDGNASTQTNPTHTYSTPGSYTVRLIVRNSSGCSDTLIKQNAVSVGSVQANFTMPPTSCVGQQIPITNTSVPPPTSVRWNFGDGTTSTAFTPIKSYSVPGTYEVKLVGDFGSCVDSITKTINILPMPAVDFTADKTGACAAPLTVTFTGASGFASYQWDFGDGNTGTGNSVTHTYTTGGNFSVTLIIVTSQGCTTSITKNGFIKIAPPTIRLDDLPVKGCAPLTHTFIPTITSADSVVSYQWNFGNGNTSSVRNPTQTFGVGIYDITLIVATAGGCSDTVTVIGGVRAGTKPVPNFSAAPRPVCANTPVQFTDLTPIPVDEWVWHFGDGDSSIDQHPVHEYEDTGTFSVTLVASHNGCRDSVRFNNYIPVMLPVARFIETVNCANPTFRRFTDRSIGADSWAWDFGDGNTSNLQNPTHTFAPGMYEVRLIVTNNATGCADTAKRLAVVVTEKPNFFADDTVICRGTSVLFKATNITPSNFMYYTWNFGDASSATALTDTISHVYTTRGTFTVRLITTNISNCRDTVTKPLYMYSGAPYARFRSSAPGTCLNNLVHFVDSSSSDGRHPIVQWHWSFGDGNDTTQAGPPHQHLYNLPGVYTVSLDVKDSNGCSDTMVRQNHVTVSKPMAQFTANDTVSCPGKPVVFTNLSTGPRLQYSWDFGDGTTSTEQNPSHVYSSDGSYTIKLRIIDEFGCTDSMFKQSYISIVTPVAEFTMSDSVGSCPPLVVTFTNNSVNYRSLTWDFGDSTSSNVVSPTHFYSEPGTYTVKLTIVSPGGCISEKTKQIIVRGPRGTFVFSNGNGCAPLNATFRATTENNSSFIWDFDDGTTLATMDSIVNHIYQNPGIYVPKVILVDQAGCQVPVISLDSIFVYGVKASFTTSTQLVCDSAMVAFTNTSIINDSVRLYRWDFGDGGTSTASNPVHFYTRTGVYYPRLIITTALGCTDTMIAPVPIRVVRAPFTTISGDTAACAPANIDLSGVIVQSDSTVVAWQWDFGNGNVSNQQDPAAQTYTTPGNYLVRLITTNITGCKDTTYRTVVVHAIPNVRADADTLICREQSYQMNATGALNYIWSPASGLSCTSCPNPVAQPDSTTTYYVTGSSVFGCSASDTITIGVKQRFDISVAEGDTICTGRRLRLSVSGTDFYTWYPSTGLDDPNSASPIASPTQTTRYMVVGRDRNGCFTDTGYATVIVYPYPLIDVGQDKTINAGQTAQLTPVVSSDVTSVIWSPAAGIHSYNYPGIIAKPMATTEYTAEASNIAGCKTSDKVTVFVVCTNANVYIPNTFSPNGDGSNEVFYVRGTGLFRIKNLKVFNRWGEMVFEKSDAQANDVTSGWNGMYKGNLQAPDVFVYTVEVLCENNTTLIYKGNVTLIH